MKRILLVLTILLLSVTPASAWWPEEGYKGTWRKLEGKIVLQEDLSFTEPAPAVEILMDESPEFATRFQFFPNGNYYCAYNVSWEDYYICGANDGSDFFCKYYTDGNIKCTEEVN